MNVAGRVPKAEALAALPPEWPQSLLPDIQARLGGRAARVVVIDDDPTGNQTVHGLPVLTEWPVEMLARELASDLPGFFLLTNARSRSLAEARHQNFEIARNLRRAARQAGRRFVVVSRSDSTLRGHFPGEVEALADGLDRPFDAWLLIPYFQEGGRYTIGDIHYVAERDWLVPAGDTPFARDPAFGYRASNLRAWVAEKSGGRIPADLVASISIVELRQGGPDQVAARLESLADQRVCVVNAACARDLEVFTLGLLTAEARGRRFLYRTAASFVSVRTGLSPRPLLRHSDLHLQSRGGALIVVGSYVPRTTAQLQALLAQPMATGVEIEAATLADPDRGAAEVSRVAARADHLLQEGRLAVLFTSRDLVTDPADGEGLAVGRRISAGLVAILRAIQTRPRCLVAKGGITASDLASEGLGVRRAMVLGQILPGVPVWRLGEESRLPGLDYVVFPGNVGEEQALVELLEKLEADND